MENFQEISVLGRCIQEKINFGETLTIKKNIICFASKNDATENSKPDSMNIRISGVDELNAEEYLRLIELINEIKGKEELGLVVDVMAPIYPPKSNNKL